MGRIDTATARGLELFYENDWNLHRWGREWVANFLGKMERKRYTHSKAVKGIADNYIPGVIKAYRKTVGYLPRVSKETKRFLAERWVRSFEARARRREYGTSADVRRWLHKNPYHQPVVHS